MTRRFLTAPLAPRRWPPPIETMAGETASPGPASPTDISISPGFRSVKAELARFSLSSFHDPEEVDEYAELFSIKRLCQEWEADHKLSRNNDLLRAVSASEIKPFAPDYADLCRLHWICLSRKVINALEFGSGFSTVIMADAMRILSGHFAAFAAANIRCETPFRVFAVEEDQRFLEITENRLGSALSPFASISLSFVEVAMHDGRITTVYSRLPNISPDLVYLDGPSQYAATREVNGFSFGSPARMPMSSDILRFEFFLEPGALILVDGRTANARFLESYLRRNWAYRHDQAGDLHFFELQEEPLGRFNRLKLNFCTEGQWLLR